MRFPLVLAYGLTLLSTAVPVWAIPKLQKEYRHRRLPTDPLVKRNAEGSCTDTSAFVTSAPKVNIFYGLSDLEVADVAAWLFAQPDLNLTVTANATDWDNTM